MGFSARKHNFIQAIGYNFHDKSQKYPNMMTKFSNDSDPCIISFEKQGMLIMGLRQEAYYHSARSPIAELWYYFNNKNSFIPKRRITKIALERGLIEQHLTVKTSNIHLLFNTTSNWEMYLFSPREYNALENFVNQTSKRNDN